MLEISLTSVGDVNSRVSRFVKRKRADLNILKVTKNEFIHAFLRSSLDELTIAISNSDILDLIQSDVLFNNKDIETINYILGQSGYRLMCYFVADDEMYPDSVPADTYEFNIVDHSFLQEDTPTVTKISQNSSESISEVILKTIDMSGLFDPNKFKGVVNPFNKYKAAIEESRKVLGMVPDTLVAGVYDMLEKMGITFQIVVGAEQ